MAAMQRKTSRLGSAHVRWLDLPKAKPATRGAPPRALHIRKSPLPHLFKRRGRTSFPCRGKRISPPPPQRKEGGGGWGGGQSPPRRDQTILFSFSMRMLTRTSTEKTFEELYNISMYLFLCYAACPCAGAPGTPLHVLFV